MVRIPVSTIWDDVHLKYSRSALHNTCSFVLARFLFNSSSSLLLRYSLCKVKVLFILTRHVNKIKSWQFLVIHSRYIFFLCYKQVDFDREECSPFFIIGLLVRSCSFRWNNNMGTSQRGLHR